MPAANDNAPSGAAVGLVQLRSDAVIERLDSKRFSIVLGSTGERFEIETHERFLLQLVLEKATVGEVCAAYRERFSPLKTRDVREFVELLHSLHLVEEPSAYAVPPAPRLQTSAAQGSEPPRPLSGRDTGGWLNTAFDLLAVVAGWLTGSLMWLVVLALALAGTNVLWRHWNEFLSESARILHDWPPLPLAAFVYARVLLLLSLPGALLLGMACRQSGGRVRTFELYRWEGLLPLFRVDLGDSMAFMNSKERRRIIVASLFYPVALAGFSLTMWRFCESDGAREFWLLMAPPALIASIMRCNIFSDSGGYFLLCDLCDEWNIRERARGETKSWLSLRRSPAPLTGRQRSWLRRYGLGEIVYRWVREGILLIGGGFLLTNWLGGAGAVLYLLLVGWRYRKHWQGFVLLAPTADVERRRL